MQDSKSSGVGSRTIAETTGETTVAAEGGTLNGTVCTDCELATIVERWTMLPEHVRKTILGIVENFG
jgi:hypothetical protein